MIDIEAATVKRLSRALTGVRVRNQRFFVALMRQIYLVTDPKLFRPTKKVEK